MVISGTSEKSVSHALLSLNSANADGFVCDVKDYRQVEAFLEFAVSKMKSIDIWINNAGIDQERELFSEIGYSSYKRVIDTNVLGMMNGSKVAFSFMQSQGHGYIYNMEGYGSNGAILEKMTVYGTSKSALTYFTRSLANEAKHTCVKVGRLSPGMVMTDFLKKGVDDSESSKKTKKIYNILADKPEDVTAFLVRRILSTSKNDAHISWLSSGKVMLRFMTAFRYKDRFYKV